MNKQPPWPVVVETGMSYLLGLAAVTVGALMILREIPPLGLAGANDVMAQVGLPRSQWDAALGLLLVYLGIGEAFIARGIWQGRRWALPFFILNDTLFLAYFLVILPFDWFGWILRAVAVVGIVWYVLRPRVKDYFRDDAGPEPDSGT